MPKAGTPLFTTKYPEQFHVRDRVLRRKDNRYYIVTGIHQVYEDGDYVYTVYGYLDPNQGHEQDEE